MAYMIFQLVSAIDCSWTAYRLAWFVRQIASTIVQWKPQCLEKPIQITGLYWRTVESKLTTVISSYIEPTNCSRMSLTPAWECN
jgi:hypothetical protein